VIVLSGEVKADSGEVRFDILTVARDGPARPG
jgi:hypothetical protein